MRHRVRAAGWGLIAVCAVVVTVIVIVGAFHAHGDAEFNRWVGWATVWALPPAALGVVLVAWEKISGNRDAPEADIRKVEDDLAADILAEAQVARSRLIGPGEPGDEPANLQYAKSTGRLHEARGATSGTLASVLHYYRSLSPRRLVVLGEPGAGKTVLALELQVRLLEARRDQARMPDDKPRELVPVLITAAAYNAEQPWDDWLAGHLALRFGISERMTTRMIRDGRILPMVDGLDEMDTDADNPQRALGLVAVLNAAMSGSQRAPIVVTCRRGEYEVLARGIDRATHIEMTELTCGEAAAYLRSQFRTRNEEQRWKSVLADLEARPEGSLAKQLATPWRLTLALTAFRDAGEPSSLLPSRSTSDEDYDRRVDSLLLGGYVPAAVRLHTPRTRYSESQVQRWLAALANGLAWQSRHSRSATDIVLHECWRSVGQRTTRAMHTAVAMLPGVGCFVVAFVTRDAGLALAGGCLLVLGCIAAFSRSPDRLSIRQVTTHRGLSEIAAWLAVGLAVGFVDWLAGWFAVASIVALIAGLATAIGGWARAGPRQSWRPRQVIRANGFYGLAGGFISGLVVGVASGIPFGLTFGMTFGVSFGFTFGLTFLANAWARYQIAVVIIAVQGRGPWRFGEFLEWGVQAGLLRVSGVAYQFRHRQLQDWLTPLDESRIYAQPKSAKVS